MGVMTCDRHNCYNIMCDTCVDDIGYICSSCQNEFKDYLKSKGLDGIITEGQLRTELKNFMRTEKDNYKGNLVDINTFFKSHTRE